jgi:hypothetical protein
MIDRASGATADRPAVAEMLDRLRAGDTVMVWRLDRLDRSLRHLIDVVRELGERGVTLVSLTEQIDTSSPGGRLVFHVFAAMAGSNATSQRAHPRRARRRPRPRSHRWPPDGVDRGEAHDCAGDACGRPGRVHDRHHTWRLTGIGVPGARTEAAARGRRVTGLIRQALATVKGWWHRVSTAVLGVVSGVVRVVRTVTVRLLGYATAVLGAIRARHRDRMSRDPSYRSAIATGLSALLVTITPQPAVAAALAVLVSEHLGSPRTAADRPAYSYDDEQSGDYESYDAHRAWSAPSPRPPQRLWDRYTD